MILHEFTSYKALFSRIIPVKKESDFAPIFPGWCSMFSPMSELPQQNQSEKLLELP